MGLYCLPWELCLEIWVSPAVPGDLGQSQLGVLNLGWKWRVACDLTTVGGPGSGL